jgi:hypothetical protein
MVNTLEIEVALSMYPAVRCDRGDAEYIRIHSCEFLNIVGIPALIKVFEFYECLMECGINFGRSHCVFRSELGFCCLKI